MACHLKPGYSKYLNPSLGSGVETIFYSNADEQVRLLSHHLDGLIKDYMPKQIVILSSRKDEDSAACTLKSRIDTGILVQQKSKKNEENLVGHCTIHSFKGMESPVVILTDINKVTGKQAESLLYIGMSRARIKLIILLHERCRRDWQNAIQEGFEQRGPSGGP